MNKREILTYLNFLNIQNRKILAMADRLDFENFFDLDKSFFDFLDEKTYNKIFSEKNLENFKYYKEKLIKTPCKLTSIFDDDYPENLKNIDDRPAILYYKGKLEKNDKYSVAFVGSRKCTDYGRWACKKIVGEIAGENIVTVSGLAYGIDACCHKTSLSLNKKTIGIIGCGIDQVYPKSNKYLYDMMEENGLIISEFPLGTGPLSFNFPRRNRIISGISLATVVIEAKEKSGTMITTSFALEQGRDVFSVPGNINSIYSRGTNKLIQDGSKLVTCGQDIIDEVLELKDFKVEKNSLNVLNLDQDQLKILEYINQNPNSNSDKIARDLNFSIDDVNYLLISLELQDYIENMGNNEYVIKR